MIKIVSKKHPMKTTNVNLEKPIFIIGVGRSGTTLLMTMLNAHSRICFPPEATFLHRYLCRPKAHKKIKKDKSQLFNLLNEDSNFKRLKMKAEDVLDNMNNDWNLKGYYLNMLRKYAISKRKNFIGDKYPRNLELLPEMKYLFPNAYIIHIIRDPRDVIASRLKTWWGQRRNFISHIGITREMLKLASEQGRKLFGERYYELRYEDLLTNTEIKLKEICEKIGVPYEKNMLNFKKSASEIVQEEELAHKAYNLKPLIHNNVSKWKKELSHIEIILIEAGCGSNIKKYGYQKKYKSLPTIFVPLNIIYIFFGQLFRIYQKIRFKRLLKYPSFNSNID